MTWREWARDVGLVCVGGLVAIAVLAPQVVLSRRDVARLERNERLLAHRCVIRPDGSVESCPAGTVTVDRVAK